MKKSWKTSLAGLAGGLLIALGPNVGARLQGDPTAAPINAQSVAPAVAIAILGLLSKDHDQTGK